MAYGKDPLAQAIADHLKIARSAIRLKHSIMADNELNDVMPVITRRLTALAQDGAVPAIDVPRLVEDYGSAADTE